MLAMPKGRAHQVLIKHGFRVYHSYTAARFLFLLESTGPTDADRCPRQRRTHLFNGFTLMLVLEFLVHDPHLMEVSKAYWAMQDDGKWKSTGQRDR